MRRLYWAHTVRGLASTMVTIFVPIYLYKLDYSLAAIMGYFLISSLFWGLTQGPVLRWANRVGFNRSMGLGLVFEGVQILMLATITIYHWPLWFLACIWGLAISLYWPQFRAAFAGSLMHQKVAPAVGVQSALLMLALGIAPAIGGAVASWLGISLLYTVAMLCFIAAAAPLFFGDELIRHEKYDMRELSWRRVSRDSD